MSKIFCYHKNTLLWSLLRDESGTTVVEYGLIATIISIIAIASMIAMGGSVNGFFTSASVGLR